MTLKKLHSGHPLKGGVQNIHKTRPGQRLNAWDEREGGKLNRKSINSISSCH